MDRRSSIAIGAVVKYFNRIARHPWIARKLLGLQAEKWLFDVVYPHKEDGCARSIRQLSIRITDVCNLRCTTCGQWGKTGFLRGKDLKELKRQEVPVERYLEIFEDLVQHGHHPLVYFWGGEPMLYEGLMELMERATGLGLPVSIATNGTRIASVAEKLVSIPMFLLQISVDGHCAELHDRIRPAAGGGKNFSDIQAALTAVQQARQAQQSTLPLVASLTVVSRANHQHLVDIYQAFRHKVDMLVFYLSWWIDPDRARKHEEDFYQRFGFKPELHWGWIADWKPDNYQVLNDQLRELKSRSRSPSSPPVILIPDLTGMESLQRYYNDHPSLFGFERCISIYQAAEVDSNGNVSPCRDYHDYVVGNIKEHTLTELWNSPAYRKFRSSLSTDGLMPVCSRCCGLMGY